MVSADSAASGLLLEGDRFNSDKAGSLEVRYWKYSLRPFLSSRSTPSDRPRGRCLRVGWMKLLRPADVYAYTSQQPTHAASHDKLPGRRMTARGIYGTPLWTYCYGYFFFPTVRFCFWTTPFSVPTTHPLLQLSSPQRWRSNLHPPLSLSHGFRKMT